VAVADFVGSSTLPLRVHSIPTGNSNITAYAGYVNGTLARVMVVNLAFWLQSFNTPRPVTQISLNVGTGVSGSALLKRLSTGLSWAGLDWPYSNVGLSVQVRHDTQNIPITNGLLQLKLNTSSAVLVSW
jgi:hypothetical protein